MCAPAARHAASTTRVLLTSAPVWDAAARVLAALRPTVSTSTGLPAAAQASTNARPSRKSSAYTAISSVPSCCENHLVENMERLREHAPAAEREEAGERAGGDVTHEPRQRRAMREVDPRQPRLAVDR